MADDAAKKVKRALKNTVSEKKARGLLRLVSHSSTPEAFAKAVKVKYGLDGKDAAKVWKVAGRVIEKPAPAKDEKKTGEET